MVRRFEPSRAGLPDPGDAATYLDARQPERPWLAAARGCPPEAQRLFAALDQRPAPEGGRDGSCPPDRF
jgi:hypothetical protein